MTEVPGPAIGYLDPGVGVVGSAVTLSGQRFGASQGSSRVKFGGRVAAVRAWRDTAITVTVPALAPRTYPVTVTTAAGTSNAVSFEVTESFLEIDTAVDDTKDIDSFQAVTGPDDKLHYKVEHPGNYYSVPRRNESNMLQRYFTLTLSKSEGVTVEHVTVALRGGGTHLMDVIDQLPVPSGNAVQILSEDETGMTLRVRVTIRTPRSQVDSVPPPAHNLVYVFTVEGTDAAGNPLSATKRISGKRALWRMLNLPRYNQPNTDPGGDNWVARGTYTWLVANRTLLKEIDDVSGEHGRFIGHQSSHRYGTDIDMYHFHPFPGAHTGPGGGTDNYNRLKKTVKFVKATRVGLGWLAKLDTVHQLIYAFGDTETNPTNGLHRGWA